VKAIELRQLSVDELHAYIAQKQKDLFELRSKAVVGSLPNPNLVRQYRKDIARCLTLITEKERGAGVTK
jgi:large subunit ribosomal protein L29